MDKDSFCARLSSVGYHHFPLFPLTLSSHGKPVAIRFKSCLPLSSQVTWGHRLQRGRSEDHTSKVPRAIHYHGIPFIPVLSFRWERYIYVFCTTTFLPTSEYGRSRQQVGGEVARRGSSITQQGRLAARGCPHSSPPRRSPGHQHHHRSAVCFLYQPSVYCLFPSTASYQLPLPTMSLLASSCPLIISSPRVSRHL